MSLGFTFNNTHSLVYDICFRSINRELLPQKEQQQYKILGRDGLLAIGDVTYSNRMIEVEISFTGITYSLEDLRKRCREIAKWLSVKGSLIFDDEPDKAYQAIIYSNINLEQMVALGSCKLVFECEPFAVTPNYITTVKTINGNNIDTLVEVQGTQETPCIISIKNTGSKPISGLEIIRKAGKQ